MGYTVAQANLYHSCFETYQARQAADLLTIIQLAVFGKNEEGD